MNKLRAAQVRLAPANDAELRARVDCAAARTRRSSRCGRRLRRGPRGEGQDRGRRPAAVTIAVPLAPELLPRRQRSRSRRAAAGGGGSLSTDAAPRRRPSAAGDRGFLSATVAGAVALATARRPPRRRSLRATRERAPRARRASCARPRPRRRASARRCRHPRAQRARRRDGALGAGAALAAAGSTDIAHAPPETKLDEQRVFWRRAQDARRPHLARPAAGYPRQSSRARSPCSSGGSGATTPRAWSACSAIGACSSPMATASRSPTRSALYTRRGRGGRGSRRAGGARRRRRGAQRVGGEWGGCFVGRSRARGAPVSYFCRWPQSR